MEALLREAGIVLLPYAALVGYVGTRERFPAPAVWAVIVCNVVWAAGSILLLVSGLVAPKPLGYAFVVAQAVVVALFAELQYVGLRRRTTRACPTPRSARASKINTASRRAWRGG